MSTCSINSIFGVSSIINKSDLHFFQWNVRSINFRSLDLTSLIARYPCPILFLSETWLLPNLNFKLNNYHIFRFNHPDSYGASDIAIRKSFQSRIIPLPPSLSDILLQHDMLPPRFSFHFLMVDLYPFQLQSFLFNLGSHFFFSTFKFPSDR